MFEVTESSIEQESLLKCVAELWRDHGHSKKRDGLSFNVFHLCGVDHYETMHSKIIAEFLNPSGSHGMGAVFLAKFLESEKIRGYLKDKFTDFTYEDARDLATARVCTEEVYEHGRCDITIHWQRWCIVIENKIYATDQPEQLKRYYDDIGRRKVPIIFYLTLDGHEASKSSAYGIEYRRLSYKDDITAWIVKCAQMAFDMPFVRESLGQYKNLIEELIGNQEEHKMDNQTVEKIVETSDAFMAASRISRVMQHARIQLAMKVIHGWCEAIKSASDLRDWELKLDDELQKLEDGIDDVSKNYVGFNLVGKNDCFSLRCEFQRGLSELFIGFISRDDFDGAMQFWKKVEASSLKTKPGYKFYPKPKDGDKGKWLYGAYPDDLTLKFWTDDVIATRIIADEANFVNDLMKLLLRMLKEAMDIARTPM